MTKAERTRQFIIEQAAPLFNTKGVAGTAMSDIMEATKMAKGGLYGHFESKEALAHAVVDYCLNTLGDKITAAVSKHKTAKGKLFAYLDFLSSPENPPLKGGCPMINFGTEADDTNSIINQKVKKGMEWSVNRITNIITEGVGNGEFHASWNAKEFAIKLFTMIEGAVLIARVMGNNDHLHTIIKMLKTEIEAQVI
ncbi:TetR/AcrR family transcriptional regulator [Mucilaginibacter phyllosphaerae]|uniref:AcrR family transcriptional regulator n=1 Tax=Mucilaginibacter phyllosphaerae TaxID=1812349 RepID=A0A4Y8AFY9_9SPHI|nr:TetR/AcrR family transcriptional regulator [Mucilaginibacter phyllosphaerae]MBB3968693.1 AcrR family transcriptional regulator [Mucilaginibacter phyllosphaerae]TEW67670.1 TetR/AcrR family transcriptional regulator [Mucilaginibacter phyllosphaerae]GGH14438.1 TetR family transcriptional regulator [Mucilaginibacter phyllosphaerae]